MSKFELFSGKLVIFLSAIVIGIPLGLIAATLHFIRILIQYPFDLYRVTYKQWFHRVTVEQADMWTKHIYRMEQKKQTQPDE
tara:strand:+ start:59 stop:304 length:246 start_codon:yes stop_codon:yes gene_type:complete